MTVSTYLNYINLENELRKMHIVGMGQQKLITITVMSYEECTNL